eukprot:TRINITY_DN10023_c0_g2_i1.p1 TRINITY_DN10023_c0_g2~~TRINITY_DN10023_c0_g2_i1.p1  ORF type:complete len:695 (+),score=139.03 TRINITY_DN10023_c0_g2_i1:58-2142(+)
MDWVWCRRRMPTTKRGTEGGSCFGCAGAQHSEAQGSAAKRPRGTPPGSRDESNSSQKELFDGLRRQDLVRLLQQTLAELGFHETRASLERESGVLLEAPEVTALRQAVQAADWDEALERCAELSPRQPEARAAIDFLLLGQKCLEMHSAGSSEAAEALFQGHVAKAASGPDAQERLEQLKQLLASSPEDLEQVHGWSLASSRELLLERLACLLPTELAVPPRRLSVLLWQALRYQQLHCLYHDADESRSDAGRSLLEDCSYTPPPLPRSCVARLRRHTDEVWFATMSHNGRFLASSSKDKTMIVWECGGGPGASFKVAQVLLGHDGPCSFLAWSPDDRYLLSTSSDCTVRLWSPPSPEPVHVLTNHSDAVTAAAWLQHSDKFVSAGFDRCMFLWDCVEGVVLHRWELACRIQDLAMMPDSKRIVVADSDRNLKVFDLLLYRELPSLPECDAVTSVCASALRDELLVNVAQHVSALQQGPTVRLWDLSARRIVQRYLGHFQTRFVVRSCFAGAREEMVVSGSEDSQVYIWHRHYGSLLQVLSGHAGTVNSVCWTAGPLVDGALAGPWLISAADDGTLRVWGVDSSDSREPSILEEEQEEEVQETPPPEVEAPVRRRPATAPGRSSSLQGERDGSPTEPGTLLREEEDEETDEEEPEPVPSAAPPEDSSDDSEGSEETLPGDETAARTAASEDGGS